MRQTRRDAIKTGAGIALGGVTTALASGSASAHQFPIGAAVHTTTALNVREYAGTNYGVVDTEPEGMRGTVIDGPVSADGYTWWNVEFDDDRYDDTATGWCATDGTWLQEGKEYTTKFTYYDGIHAETALNVRDAPSTSGTDEFSVPAGQSGTVYAGPRQADGYTWWKVGWHGEGTGWTADDGTWLAEGCFPGCGPGYYSSDNRYALGKILNTEASTGLVSDSARRAVAYTVMNRMERNDTTSVYDVWGGYAHSREPTSADLSLAEDVLTCSVADNSAGATHYYSPYSMPKEGDSTGGYNVGGGLEKVPGLSERNYRPDWSRTMIRAYVVGPQQKFFKFYRDQGDGYTA